MFYLNPLAGTDYIARLYGFRQRDEQGKPSTAAFMLRLEQGEDFLSCVWLEYFHSNCRNVQIQGALKSLRSKRKVPVSARLAVMGISDVLRRCAEAGALAEVNTTGEIDDPSHAGVYGYVHANAEVAAVLARNVRHEIYPTA